MGVRRCHTNGQILVLTDENMSTTGWHVVNERRTILMKGLSPRPVPWCQPELGACIKLEQLYMSRRESETRSAPSSLC